MSYSYSALSAAYRCNRYYKYLYVDKLVQPGLPSADMAFGSAVHFAMEELFEGKDPLQAFHVYWDQGKTKLKYGRFQADRLEVIAEILLPRFQKLHAKKFVPYQSEIRLYGELNGIKLEGTPDMLGLYEGVESVIDFKTAAYRYPPEKVVLNEQMILYAYLAQTVAHYPVKQVVYKVFTKERDPTIQTLVQELTPELLANTLANITVQCKNLDHLRETNQWSQNRNSCLMGEVRCAFFDTCWPLSTPSRPGKK